MSCTLRHRLDPLRFAELCQMVENRVVGALCGIMDQVAATIGRRGLLLRLLCQPHRLLDPLKLPQGIQVIGINTRVEHSIGDSDGAYGKTRCAAFMGHKLILHNLVQGGTMSGMSLCQDPYRGYLANTGSQAYSARFRALLPELMPGAEFIARFGSTFDTATAVDPAISYHIRAAVDHHVYEADRARQFVALLERATAVEPNSAERCALLDAAGELMYESHRSYTQSARLGAGECDCIVELVRQHRPAGIYGARISGGGSGGTVVVLAETTLEAEIAIRAIMEQYQRETGHAPEALVGSSDGAWSIGTRIVR